MRHPQTSRRKLTAFLTVAVLTLFACQAVTGATPTPLPTAAPPPAEPTATQPIPTATMAPEPEPTATQPETADPLPTQATDPLPPAADGTLAVTQVRGFFDNLDSWRVIGLVQNGTDRAVDQVEIEVVVFDDSDQAIYTEVTRTDVSIVDVGETVPFSLFIFEDLSNPTRFAAEIVGRSISDEEQAPVEVRRVSALVDDDGDMHISGELVNNNDYPIEVDSLAAATFFPDGVIMAADSHDVSVRYLAPGEDGPFRVSLIAPQGGVDRVDDYAIYLSAVETEAESVVDVAIGDAFNFYDVWDDFHLVGEVTNEGALPLDLNLIAAVYDADDNVLDVAEESLSINELKPGESLPYEFDSWGILNYSNSIFDLAETYTIQIDRYWTWEATTRYADLTTIDDAVTFDEYNGDYTGTIVNETDETYSGAVIVIYLVDKETGAIVGLGQDFSYDELPPNGTYDYEVYMDIYDDFDPAAVDAVYLVKGERQ